MQRQDAELASSPAARVLPAQDLIDLVRGVTGAGGSLWVQVTGISMNPMVREGDSVLLAGLTRSPRRGDVVFVDVGGTPLLHRVRELDGGMVLTRGDASLADDAPAPTSACVARALVVRRGSATVALTPTLRFGVKALLWFAAWTIRVRIPSPSGSRVRAPSRGITRALA